MTEESTPRDRAWIDVIQNSLTTGSAVKSSQIEERADVSRTTSRGVLQAAEQAELLTHEDGAHWYYPTLVFVAQVEHDDTRRFVRDVLADDRNKTMIEDITWYCEECRAETEYRIIDQNITQASPGWYIDTEVECLVCEQVQEVTEHSRRDPRKE